MTGREKLCQRDSKDFVEHFLTNQSPNMSEEERREFMRSDSDDNDDSDDFDTHDSNDLPTTSPRNQPLVRRDLDVMKGIARSGALNILREVGGLYNPRMNSEPCNNLPATPEAYMTTPWLSLCGLSDLVLGDNVEVTINWPSEVVRRSGVLRSPMWHTHPINPDLTHMPPSSADLYVSVLGAFGEEVDTDQLIVTSEGVWRVYCSYDHLLSLDPSDKYIEEMLILFNNLAIGIQSEDQRERLNKEAIWKNEPHKYIKKMTTEEFVDVVNREIPLFNTEFYRYF